jgi:hypothetical protein
MSSFLHIVIPFPSRSPTFKLYSSFSKLYPSYQTPYTRFSISPFLIRLPYLHLLHSHSMHFSAHSAFSLHIFSSGLPGRNRIQNSPKFWNALLLLPYRKHKYVSMWEFRFPAKCLWVSVRQIPNVCRSVHLWRWGHYTDSKCRGLITHWRDFFYQKNRILGCTSSKN